MFSMFGCYVHALVTSECSAEDWAFHIAGPFAVNGLTSAYVTQLAPSPVAVFAVAGGKNSAWCGANRNKWLGPFSSDGVDGHLSGEYPGDYGWDTAGFAADPKTFERYRGAQSCQTPRGAGRGGACWGCAHGGGGGTLRRGIRRDPVAAPRLAVPVAWPTGLARRTSGGAPLGPEGTLSRLASAGRGATFCPWPA